MPATADQTIHDILAVLTTSLVVGYALWLLVSRLARSRPGLSIGAPVAFALLVRVAAAAGVSLTEVARTLRAGDELVFLSTAQQLSEGYLSWTGVDLHEAVFAFQLSVLDASDLALRITQAGIAVAGLALLAVAVYELAGPRAATIAMWLLAFEPASIFFSGLLHKEANVMLAAGLVAFGGALLWKSGKLNSLLPIGLGCLVAIATRPYAGWFLVAAAAAITLHAGLKAHRQASIKGAALVAAVVVFGAITAPTLAELSSDQSLEQNLQGTQDAVLNKEYENLTLEPVDFSSREAVIANLPQRVFDVLVRPYPWQLANTQQQLGSLGSLVALSVLAVLGWQVIRNLGRIMASAGPLVYVGLFLLIAYSLSAANAGTGFRYRTHLVGLGICTLVVLWIAWERRRRSIVKPSSEPTWRLAGTSAAEQA
jgi:hypothetical protein